VSESVDFGRQKHFWYCAPFRALADEGDGIAFDEVVSSGVIKEHAHQIPNLGTTSPGEWKRPEPQLNLDCPDRAHIGCSPPRHDPLSQIALVCDSRRQRLPFVISGEFSLTAMLGQELISSIRFGHLREDRQVNSFRF
jgi:hypothetical protein